MDNLTAGDDSHASPDAVRWHCVLGGFLCICLASAEYGNILLLYNICMKKLNCLSAQLVKALTVCNTINVLFLISPAAITSIADRWVFGRTGCVYQRLVLQVFVIANRLLMLILLLEHLSILMRKRGYHVLKSSLSAVLLGIFLLSVSISSLTIIQEDTYQTKSNVYICLLPPAWFTVAYNVISCIIPCTCILLTATYATCTAIANGPRQRSTRETNGSRSADGQHSIFSPGSCATVLSIVAIEIPVAFLSVSASVIGLAAIFSNADPMALMISFICDTTACVLQPFLLFVANPVLRNNFVTRISRNFTRTEKSVYLNKRPSAVSDRQNTKISSSSSNESTSSNGGDTFAIILHSVPPSDGNTVPMSLQLSPAQRNNVCKVDKPREEDESMQPEYSGEDSSVVQVGSTVGIYRYISGCRRSSMHIQINDDVGESTEENPPDSSRENDPQSFSFHNINKKFRITYPHRRISCSTSHRYRMTSSSTTQSAAMAMMAQDEQMQHLHSRMIHDAENGLPDVQVDSIGIASSSHYEFSSSNLGSETEAPRHKCSGASRTSVELEVRDLGSQCAGNYWMISKKESDTGELVLGI